MEPTINNFTLPTNIKIFKSRTKAVPNKLMEYFSDLHTRLVTGTSSHCC